MGRDIEIARDGAPGRAITGALAAAEPFQFPWAGGMMGGGDSTPSTYDVYVSHDNDTDPYEQAYDKNGDAIQLVITVGQKDAIPESMFNVKWCKLVGPSGSVRFSGVG